MNPFELSPWISGAIVILAVLMLVGVVYAVSRLLPLSAFAACNAVIIDTILAMANPYSPPGAIKPLAFVEIFRHDTADLLAIAP